MINVTTEFFRLVQLNGCFRFVSGAPNGKRIIIFVDDLNMPKLDTYGSQPPIELLRQYQDFGGLYDREKMFWKEIHVCSTF